ncbi:MAG: pyridoxal-dependent decarboxylase, partial [Pseudomonadota bacterium]
MHSNEEWHEFAKWSHRIVDWTAHYRKTIAERPVRAKLCAGQVAEQIPENPPQTRESFHAIMADFEAIIMPGITHWQHPRFFAYFPANASPASVLGEQLAAGLSVNALIWQTS